MRLCKMFYITIKFKKVKGYIKKNYVFMIKKKLNSKKV